ncbi:Eco57I restriction-modification methylase domain-containing protein [Nannocystaceae bacterium ST9]
MLAMARDLRAFHWPLEFPEVFHRTPRGFDVIVANPPFLGSQLIRAAFGSAATDYLHSRSGMLVDLCGLFMLRFRDLLNDRSAFGVVAPNSIAQAKMRRLVIVPLAREFEISRACASRPWPGDASVHVAIVHMHRVGPGLIARRRIVEACDPNGSVTGLVAVRSTTTISSFLDDGPETELYELAGQGSIAFQGMIGRGKFDRPLKFAKQVPTRERRALYAHLNNRDLQHQSAPRARRVVIDVTDALADAGLLDATSGAQETWLKSNLPTLYAALRDTVRRERRVLPDVRRNDRLRSSWWLFGNPCMALRSAWQGLALVIVIGAVGKTMVPQSIARVDAGCGLPIVPTHQLFIIPSSSPAVLAILTSRVFETFTRRACSSLKSDLRFTPTEVFPFFPFPWLGGSSVLDVPEAVERRLTGPVQSISAKPSSRTLNGTA